MGPSHTQESVAQLRQLDGTACVICGTIRSRRGNRCNHCRTDTATRDRVVGKKFQDRRQPDHPGATTSLPTRHPLSTRSQPIPQGEPLDESPLPNGPNPRHESSRSVTHSCLATFTELQRWPVREPLFPLRERAWREPSVVTSPPPSCADIAADDCGPKFPRRRQQHSIKTASTAVGCGRMSRSGWKNSRSDNKTGKRNHAAADRRTAG